MEASSFICSNLFKLKKTTSTFKSQPLSKYWYITSTEQLYKRVM